MIQCPLKSSIMMICHQTFTGENSPGRDQLMVKQPNRRTVAVVAVKVAKLAFDLTRMRRFNICNMSNQPSCPLSGIS